MTFQEAELRRILGRDMGLEISVRFETAGPHEADAIRSVVRSAYAKWVPVIGREPRPMQADYARAVLEHRIDVLFAGPDMVGLIETILRADHLWIENVAVRPDRQGEGFGRRLLAHADDQAAEAGVSELRLLTNAAFEANVHLYESTGYVVVGRDEVLGGTVHMTKELDRAA